MVKFYDALQALATVSHSAIRGQSSRSQWSCCRHFSLQPSAFFMSPFPGARPEPVPKRDKSRQNATKRDIGFPLALNPQLSTRNFPAALPTGPATKGRSFHLSFRTPQHTAHLPAGRRAHIQCFVKRGHVTQSRGNVPWRESTSPRICGPSSSGKSVRAGG
jgi:hypothetical protein